MGESLDLITTKRLLLGTIWHKQQNLVVSKTYWMALENQSLVSWTGKPKNGMNSKQEVKVGDIVTFLKKGPEFKTGQWLYSFY